MSLQNFNTQVFGDSSLPKCVFLHGILGQGKNWRSFARRFSENFECLIYDQRGHGDSYQPASGYDLTDFAGDLEIILKGLHWDEPIFLLGHSMGGRVALRYATDFPEKVKKLVIVDIGPTSKWSSMEKIISRIQQVPVPFESKSEAKAYFAGEFLQEHGKAMANFFETNVKPVEDNRWDWGFSKRGILQCLESSRLKDYWDLFLNLKCETLLIRGENSTDLPQEDFDRIVANNPRIRGVVIPKAGHWVHADQPAETLKVLEEFFLIATPVS